MQTILEIIGWVGSILIVWSLMQARVLRFRWMNFAGAVVATFYNAVIEVWPFAAMNFAIAIIDAYWLMRLYRERHDADVYQVIELDSGDGFLTHVLKEHAGDIADHQPDFEPAPAEGERRHSFLVVRGDEAVGVVAVADRGDGVGEVQLDWVKERFRDFTPGEFVYHQSGALSGAGFQSVEIRDHEALDREYLRRVGFEQREQRWVQQLAA